MSKAITLRCKACNTIMGRLPGSDVPYCPDCKERIAMPNNLSEAELTKRVENVQKAITWSEAGFGVQTELRRYILAWHAKDSQQTKGETE